MPSRPSTGPAGPRRGSVTPLTVLCLSLLVGVAAFALDGGSLLEERRHVQAAADAAALAAADDLLANYATNQGGDPGGTAAQSALANAAANGYGNDGVQSVVTVTVSPGKYQGGPNAGQPLPPGYAEVLVQYNATRNLSGVFGSGSMPVRARAVARGVYGPSGSGLALLNLHASSALNISGLGGLDVGTESVQLNSDSSGALNLSLGASLKTPLLNLGGTVNLLLSILSSLLSPGGGSSSVNYGEPVPDPLRSVAAPDPIALGLTSRETNLHVSAGTVDLYPGTYAGGIQVSGGATAVLHANADGTPGIYYLQGGGLKVSQLASLTMAAGETAGVMIYNDWSGSSDTITLTALGRVAIDPPASGTYKGLSLFQKRGTPSQAGPPLTVSGQGAVNLAGTLYAAHATVSLSSGLFGVNVMGGQIVADSLTVMALATIKIDRGSKPVANTRLYGLVE